jgi:hypothetical protein
MSTSELRITEVAPNGETLSCAVCYAGLISVLRSTSAFELSDYEHALFGMPGARRLQVSLNGRQFRTQDAIYIGVGERFASSEVSVREFLQRAGFTRSEGNKLLTSLGLERILRQKLSEFERAIVDLLRLLAACKERGSLIVVAEPFRVLEASAREVLAEWLMRMADQHELILVVTRLSERPQVWVDSINVARVSLDDSAPLEGTVGPLGANAATQAVLNRLRTRVREQEARGSSEIDLRLQERSRRIVWTAFSGSVLLACILGVIVFRAQHFAVQEEVQVEISARQALPGQGSSTFETRAGRTAAEVGLSPKSSADSQVFAYGNHERLVLSLYPIQIQESVNAAFRMEKRELSAAPVAPEPEADAQELLQLLAVASQADSASGTAPAGVYQPAIAPPPDLGNSDYAAPPVVAAESSFSDQEWEQRREEMRRRFLEAVMANSQQ